jgi:beta-xylosidase
MLGDVPLLSYDLTRYVHVIDAEVFIDDDERIYLYWGSGWEWTNGRCFVAELNPDMRTFKTEAVEVTPTNFFEAPFMVKHNGIYFLTYSEGITIDETYEVRYATGGSPFGPFIEAENSPILTYDESLQVFGPGHHSMYTIEGKHYILYHRHRLPFVRGGAYRQTCIQEFTFNEEGTKINNIIPAHTQVFPNFSKKTVQYIQPEMLTASSSQAAHTRPEFAMDNHYGTRWESADDDKNPHLTATFEAVTHIENLEIRFEYPWKNYYLKVETSLNGNDWKTIADYTTSGVSGSPVNVPISEKCKNIRLSFVDMPNSGKPSVWEVRFE